MPQKHESSEQWSVVHDLALVYMALAYGTDQQLSEVEIKTLHGMLKSWGARFNKPAPEEIAVEALAVYLTSEARSEVLQSIRNLRQSLNRQERQEVLQDLVHIAEADGVLLSSEKSLISELSREWEMKDTGERLIDRITVPSIEQAAWTVMHDISLIFVVLAHATDNDLSRPEINVMLERVGDWQPDLDGTQIETILREALQVYAAGPGTEILQRSVSTIRDALPMMQRIALLDDLVNIAEADGSFDDYEREMIASLAQAWRIHVRLNGRYPH